MTNHRVIAVGDRRNKNRFLAVVGNAVGDALAAERKVIPVDVRERIHSRVTVEVMRQMAAEGYVLTRQVRLPRDA